jgi:DNA replication protein DnaC
MNVITTTIISLLNNILPNYISFGNRTIDFAIISSIITILTLILNINYKNYFIFYWNMFVSKFKNNDIDKFNSNYYICDLDMKHQISFHIPTTESLNIINNYLTNLAKDNKYAQNPSITRTQTQLSILRINNESLSNIYMLYYCNHYNCMIYFTNYTLEPATLLFYCSSSDALNKYMKNVLDINNITDYLGKTQINRRAIYHIENAAFKAKGNISIKKNLNNFFFDNKSEFIDILDKFKDNKLYPESVSMDNKIGIFLHGPPGTGKTGLILAVANYLNYDIINIDFTKNNKISDFEFLFTKSTYSNRIIVFDEIDYLLTKLNNIEKLNINETETLSTIDNLVKLCLENKKDTQDTQDKTSAPIQTPIIDHNITFEYLLSKLDGIEDNNGRIIMATTNYPELFQKRFLRPGRFDLIIHMNNCSQQMYIDIISNFYNISQDLLKDYIYPEFKYSPLELHNLCIKNQNNYKSVLNIILDL